ncbi:sodium-dependent transporter [Tessaracoccus flavus]|uniref:Transporter n=1 Tax=Tessaracoccus flavus TaxID=1610493 RepID=A0A1Q2CIG9_9ACTN|nr:sodium-dependent transporter [Tessaracoccus flavus]AQP45845.1 sodium-dependent transporter [Tessaracoccus flavus]SDZ15260.1 neurotransmitter:Na+ symporter, NSS family [Tessaracoccus flavus]
MADPTVVKREVFSSRNVFILAAIGSAVGLGNIWRFPYVAYSNGGGAFVIPYLVALLTAGIPLLFFDYAIGHRYRSSAPLAMRRVGRAKWVESLGWWQVLVCFVIAVYYAAILAWAGMYFIFSFNQSWGDDAQAFLYGEFLQLADTPHIGFDFVPQVAMPMALVWVVTLVVIALGVRRGIARANVVMIPLLLVMFLILVFQAIMLPGAVDGLNAFFTPDWSALTNPGVWAAAYGQIFFSLSVGFGIMITYSSYLRRRTNLTGSGLVVGFANSSFELLAGIGVFAALGFMMQATNQTMDEVAAGGIGLAFIAFPTIVSTTNLGPVIGVLFFASLMFAGFTSMISIVEVCVSAVRDKMGLSRVMATAAVGIPMAAVSMLFLPTTTGLYFLDITDEFINKFGILLGAFTSVLVVGWILRKLPALQQHLDRVSSVRFGKLWLGLVGILVPIVLGYIVFNEILTKIQAPYGDYPAGMLGIFGWGMAGGIIIVAVVIAFATRWRRDVVTEIDEAALNVKYEEIMQK